MVFQFELDLVQSRLDIDDSRIQIASGHGCTGDLGQKIVVQEYRRPVIRFHLEVH